MTRIERLLIICLLVSRSMEVEKTVEFVDIIESGCLAHEEDSIQYKDSLVRAAQTAPIDGEYGSALTMLLQAHEIENAVDILQKHENHLDKLIASLNQPAKNRIGEKILLSKLAEFVKNHPSALQEA